MKSVSFLIIMFVASVCYAGGNGPINTPNGTTMVRPNIGGGYNFYSNHGYSGRAMPNYFGNYNYYDRRGFMYSQGRSTVGGQYRFRYYGR